MNIDAAPSFRLHRVWAVGHNSLTNGLRCQFQQEGTGEDPGARVFGESLDRTAATGQVRILEFLANEVSPANGLGSSQLTHEPPET